MSNSTLIIVRDLTTGAGRSGLVVKLKNHLDNFTADVATGTELVGKPGVYEFIDLPLAKYKEYIGGVEDKSLGGTHGKWLPICEGLVTIDGDQTIIGNKVFSGSNTHSGNNTLSGNNSFSGFNVFGGVTGYSSEKILSISTEFVYRKWVEQYATTNFALLSGNNTFSGINVFTGKSWFYGGSSSGTRNKFLGWNSFDDFPPIYTGTNPYSGYQQLVTKGWVEGQLESITEGNYIESPNIIRLAPDAAPQLYQVYGTWADALTYAGSVAASNRWMSILVVGHGTGASSITPALVSSKFIKDYVHFKAHGSGINLAIGGASGTEWTATDFTKVIIEGFNISINDSENPTNFAGITFKDCNFNIIDTAGVTFLNCRFVGANTFTDTFNNQYTFTNCIGSRILTAHTVTIDGTNHIPYYSLTEISLGSCKIFNDGTGNFKTNNGIISGGGIIAAAMIQANDKLLVKNELLLEDVGGSAPNSTALLAAPTEAFGLSGSNKMLCEPVAWLNVTVQGTIYSIPLYSL